MPRDVSGGAGWAKACLLLPSGFCGLAGQLGLCCKDSWRPGVLSCRQRQMPGMTLSAQHIQGGPQGKDTIRLGLLFQLYLKKSIKTNRPAGSCCSGTPHVPPTCSSAPEAFSWSWARHGSTLPKLHPLPHQPWPAQHCPYSLLQISHSFPQGCPLLPAQWRGLGPGCQKRVPGGCVSPMNLTAAFRKVA